MNNRTGSIAKRLNAALVRRKFFHTLLIDLAVFAFQLIEIEFPDTLGWTLIYSLFVLVGIVIAFLLHYAFKKED